jgi:hypothetical protein
MGVCSRNRYRIIKEKVFLVSEVLEEAKIDASASSLGLEGFQKLIKSAGGKKRDPEGSGKIHVFNLFPLQRLSGNEIIF